MNIFFHDHPNITFAGSAAFLGIGRLFHDLAKTSGDVNQILPWLSAISYVVGIAAAVITIIYTIKNKKP